MVLEKGQLSLELLLLSLITIILLSLILIPFVSYCSEIIIDTTSSLNIKSEMSKITNGINQVYTEGCGSKRVISLNLNKESFIVFSPLNLKEGKATSSYRLSNNQLKNIEIIYKCPDLNTNLHLSKGYNKVLIFWSENSNIIELSKLN